MFHSFQCDDRTFFCLYVFLVLANQFGTTGGLTRARIQVVAKIKGRIALYVFTHAHFGLYASDDDMYVYPNIFL